MIINNKKLKYTTLGLCAAILMAVPSNDARAEGVFTPEQKAELEVLFKEYIANNPQAILESVDNYRAVQEQRTQQSAQENLKEYTEFFAQKDLPSAGNPDGDVTIVEYFDYNCGYCKKALEDIQKFIEKDKNIRVVFQEMPILSPASGKMAEIALAANMQGKYFEMHTALMNYRGTQNVEAFIGLAENLGLDIEKLRRDAASNEVRSQIDKALEMARTLGIRGTPGFIVGDKIYPGYIGMQGLEKAIAEARAANAQ